MEVNIAGTLAPILGTLQGQLETKVQTTILDVRTRLQGILQKELEVQKNVLLQSIDCQKLDSQIARISLSMEDLKRKRDGAISFLQKANTKVQSIQKVITGIQAALIAAKVIIKVVKLLPIPQAVLGIGLPMSLTILASDLLAFTQKLVEGLLKAVTALNIILIGVLKIIQVLLNLLKNLDFLFKLLLDALETLKALCSGEIKKEDLLDAGLVTPEGTLLLTTLAQDNLKTLNIQKELVKDASLFSGTEVTGDCRGVSVEWKDYWKSKQQYTANKSVRDSVSRFGEVFLCKQSHLSTEQEVPENSKYWEKLCKEVEYPKHLTSMCGILQEIYRKRSFSDPLAKPLQSTIQELYTRIKTSNLPETFKKKLEVTFDLEEEVPGTGLELWKYYISNKGVRYRLQIYRDETYINIAPQHYVNAYLDTGFLVLKGDSSFSSSTEILFQEIIFQIETQL